MGAVALAAFTGHAWADEAAPAHTTLESTELEATGIDSLAGLTQALPDLTTGPTWNSLTTPSLFMRGQGVQDPSQITLDGGVGIYEDGFPVARAQGLTFDLLDLDQVQVLQGPESLLAARVSPGGTINFVSTPPAGVLRFDQFAELGSRNSFRILSSLDTPTWQGLSGKVTLLASSIDGYTNNPAPQGTPPQLVNSPGQENERAGRLQLRWQIAAALRADYFIERNELDSTAPYDSNPALNGQDIYGPFSIPYQASTTPPSSTYRFIPLPLSTSAHVAQGLTLTWQPSEALRLQSLTGYRTLGANEYQDYAEAFGFMENTLDHYSDNQLSQQLTMQGSVLKRQISYLVGGSYFKERGAQDTDFDFPAILSNGEEVNRPIAADSTSVAGYAQLSFRPDFVGRHLELSLDGRFTHDTLDAQRSLIDSLAGTLENAAVASLGYHRTCPGATLTYHITDHLSLYAQGTRSFQPGGFLEYAPPGELATMLFQPDSRTTYEVGLASQPLDEALQVRASAFETRYKNLQYAVPYGIIVDDIDTIQKATLRGADLDLRFSAARSLALTLRGEYLQPEIESADVGAGSILDPAVDSSAPYKVGQNVADLYAMPYTPKYSVTAGGDYTFLHLDRRDITAHLDYAYRGDVASSAAAGPAVPNHELDTIPAFGVLDARLTLSQETDFSHHVKISLRGDNVLNRRYFVLAGGVGPDGLGSGEVPASSGSPGLAGYSSRAVAWAPPPIYGVSFTYEY